MPVTSDEEWGAVWPALQALGWRHELLRRSGTGDIHYYLPAGIERGMEGYKIRKDYFDSKAQVLKYLRGREVNGDPLLPAGSIPAPPTATGSPTASDQARKRSKVASNGSEHVAPAKRARTAHGLTGWLADLQNGQRVDANCRTHQGWHHASVVELAADKVKVHYVGWSSTKDEWLDRSPAAIQPPGLAAPKGSPKSTSAVAPAAHAAGVRRTSRKGAGQGVDRLVPVDPDLSEDEKEDPPPKKKKHNNQYTVNRTTSNNDKQAEKSAAAKTSSATGAPSSPRGGNGSSKSRSSRAGSQLRAKSATAPKFLQGRNGEPSEISCDSARIHLHDYRIKIGLATPHPRIVIRCASTLSWFCVVCVACTFFAVPTD